MRTSWITGEIKTPAGDIPVVSTRLTWRDRLGEAGVRLGRRRNDYRVEPGLYAAGSPVGASPVLVTANYKLSFDSLRSKLAGRDAWIMVLDTKGINVWCAAGKGTFGTAELVDRAKAVRLGEIVSHGHLVLPQLGAVGVSAFTVKKLAGWRVVFGPVRSEDLPAFLDSGMKAAPGMRRVEFPLKDRLALVPLEIVHYFKYVAISAAVIFLLSGMFRGGYSLDRARETAPDNILALALAYLAGVVLVPALLPWLPGRAFSLKGALAGLAVTIIAAAWAWAGRPVNPAPLEAAAWILMGPAVSSYLAMNFTGASTYTSMSGVRREMRIAVPSQVAAAAVGVVIWIAARFF